LGSITGRVVAPGSPRKQAPGSPVGAARTAHLTVPGGGTRRPGRIWSPAWPLPIPRASVPGKRQRRLLDMES